MSCFVCHGCELRRRVSHSSYHVYHAVSDWRNDPRFPQERASGSNRQPSTGVLLKHDSYCSNIFFQILVRRLRAKAWPSVRINSRPSKADRLQKGRKTAAGEDAAVGSFGLPPSGSHITVLKALVAEADGDVMGKQIGVHYRKWHGWRTRPPYLLKLFFGRFLAVLIYDHFHSHFHIAA